jgi:hypothetical protein
MTVDYQPLANGGSANVETQAQFLIDIAPGGALQNGFQSGIAASAKYNKVLRQSSMISAAVANLIANTLSINVLDDGNLTNLVNNLVAAIQQTAATGAWSTGDVKLTMKTVADPTWLMCNDGTIGDASSGANFANVSALNLFTLLWTNVSNTFAPVVGGRGASAAADWAAHKQLTLTLMLGRSLAVSGAGFGLTNRVLGANVGEETHLLSIGEMPSHTHTSTKGFPGTGGQSAIDTNSNCSGLFTDTSFMGAVGGGGAHNNMQPTSFLNAMIKL